jgi:two-component system C4-dicarboxylate transport response regulator DctD
MPELSRVLFVDDEEPMRQAVTQWLTLGGFDLVVRESGNAAVADISEDFPGILVTDLRMEGLDGIGLLQMVQQVDPELPVIVITGHGDIETAVRAMQLGAYDFIEKPFAPDRFLGVVQRASEKRQLVIENRRLRRTIGEKNLNARIIGTSPAVERLRADVAELASTDVSVILYGETGAGKDLVARCLHEFGRRQKGNYVAVNCAAVPDTMVESEFFGHEAGAFTGAVKARPGKLEHASGGTLFLDEIDSMPVAAQGKLLRVLQEKVLERLGSNRSVPIDVRAVAASKVDLRAASAEGRFRLDLYYRLSVVELVIPPLRQRAEDIPLLFEYFARSAADSHGRELRPISASVMERLMAHDWPGNVRELRNAAERYALGIDAGRIPSAAASTKSGTGPSLAEQVDAFERAVIERCLIESNGKIGAVMQRLDVPRRTLADKMARYGLDRRRYTDTVGQKSAKAAPAIGGKPHGD